jgi:hypothetical protein
MYKSLLIILFLLVTRSSPALADNKERIAVLDLENKTEIKSQEIEYLSDLLRQVASELSSSKYSVITKDNIYVLLPPKVSLEDCLGSCAVETGRRLNAHWVFIGSVVKFGSSIRFILNLHHTQSGELRASKIVKAKTVELLETPLRQAMTELLSTIDPSHGIKKSTRPFPGSSMGVPVQSNPIIKTTREGSSSSGGSVSFDASSILQQANVEKEQINAQVDGLNRLKNWLSHTRWYRLSIGKITPDTQNTPNDHIWLHIDINTKSSHSIYDEHFSRLNQIATGGDQTVYYSTISQSSQVKLKFYRDSLKKFSVNTSDLYELYGSVTSSGVRRSFRRCHIISSL